MGGSLWCREGGRGGGVDEGAGALSSEPRTAPPPPVGVGESTWREVKIYWVTHNQLLQTVLNISNNIHIESIKLDKISDY